MPLKIQMKQLRRFIRVAFWGAAVAVAVFIVFLLVAVISDYRPEDCEAVYAYSVDGGDAGLACVSRRGIWDDVDSAAVVRLGCDAQDGEDALGSSHSEAVVENDAVQIDDNLKIVTWNIGYGGLGSNMDFFYDGGTQIRDTEARTMRNLGGILAEMKAMDADIYLLQEVDECSRRTYRINELAMLQAAFPEYHLYFACNYRSFFVPIPLRSPMGKVASGLVILSRYRAEKVERLAYPSRFPFPVSLFNLKRCLLAATFRLPDGGLLAVGNTHNTAYDAGGMREQETGFLASWIDSLQSQGVKVLVGGDWNQYPPAYVPGEDETANPHFSVAPLRFSAFDANGRIVYDSSGKTLRYLDKPYSRNSTLTVTDYFYVSHSLSSSDARLCGNVGFSCSDHRPVCITVYPD